jgi:spore coat polysaccharide biosynthesis predicted glycosyltransferase SpsG
MAGLKILFRTDADAIMGTGHVMRCLALAEALRDLGHECHFLCATLPPALQARLAGEEIRLHRVGDVADGQGRRLTDEEAQATLHMESAIGAAVLVVDGYHFGADWRRIAYAGAHRAGRRVLALLDDVEGPVAHADLVVNPVAAPRGLPGCLFGADFVLLRRDIRRAMVEAPPIERRTYILVTFGGSDPAGLTVPVTAALVATLGDGVPLCVVIGGAVPGGDAMAAALAALPGAVDVRRDVRDMGLLMAQAGLAVSAGGGTLGELAALAVPAIFVAVADNQVAGAAHAMRDGWCVAMDGREAGAPAAIARLATTLWHDLPRRRGWSDHARGTIDGEGAVRVAQRLIDGLIGTR